MRGLWAGILRGQDESDVKGFESYCIANIPRAYARRYREGLSTRLSRQMARLLRKPRVPQSLLSLCTVPATGWSTLLHWSGDLPIAQWALQIWIWESCWLDESWRGFLTRASYFLTRATYSKKWIHSKTVSQDETWLTCPPSTCLRICW